MCHLHDKTIACIQYACIIIVIITIIIIIVMI